MVHQYDEAGRMVRSIEESAWTPEDRALMLARAAYKRTLCPKCGHPKETAWHPDNEGWFEVVEEITCHGCTALANHGREATYEPTQFLVVGDTRDYGRSPLPPQPALRPDSDAMGGAR